jgi:hypothetical protein
MTIDVPLVEHGQERLDFGAARQETGDAPGIIEHDTHAGKEKQQMKFAILLKSRKFWAAVVGLAYVFFGARAGISQSDLVSGVALLVAYIMGTALEDGLSARG